MNSNGDLARTRFVDPILITTALWAFVLIGATFSDLNPLSPIFLVFLGVGVGSHVCGMVVGRYAVTKGKRKLATLIGVAQRAALEPKFRAIARAKQIVWYLLVFEVIGMIYFLLAYSQVVPSFDSDGFLAARSVYLEEARRLKDKVFIYTTHLTLFGIGVLFFAAHIYRKAVDLGLRRSMTQFNLAGIITLIVAILTTGRTAPLLVILSYSFYCLRFQILGKRAIVSAFAITSFAMFFAVAFALGKEGLGDTNKIGVSEALVNLGRVYFFSAPIAMQEVFINNQVVSNACSNIFSYPIELLKRIGMFAQCDGRELEFVFVPVATNVFTFLRAYWEDFGWAYPAALFVTGYLVETVHKYAFLRPGYAAFLFPFVLNALLLQIFEEQLFANGSVFAYLTLIYVVLSRILRLPLVSCPILARNQPETSI